jgi:hypothetical protein
MGDQPHVVNGHVIRDGHEIVVPLRDEAGKHGNASAGQCGREQCVSAVGRA